MRPKRRGLGLFVLFVIISIGIIAGYFNVHKSTKDIAVEMIDTFYEYEQEGAFSDSWAMFHPQMKEKFPKVDYLQERPNLLLSGFEVETFTYTLGEPEKVQDWMMEDGSEPIDVAYKVTVTQTFQGKYGKFDIEQDVYATEMEGEWAILWDYGGRS